MTREETKRAIDMSLANKFDEYCKNHEACGEECDVGECMRDFCYQQGYDDAMELLSGTSVAYSFLNDEKHKAYQQGREDALADCTSDLTDLTWDIENGALSHTENADGEWETITFSYEEWAKVTKFIEELRGDKA